MLVNREASAMLDCEEGAKQADCKHCQGGESSSEQPQRYWDIPLDADLLETIVKIYPDWFDDDPRHKNKESLKVKLMLRRPPLNKRADQGILPPLKSAFHEQIQKLERSNMGDILKHKFQKKPDRQELIPHHILDDAEEEEEAKKLSKKARLSDSMSPADHHLLTRGVADELLAQAAVRADNAKGACPSPRLRTTFEEDSGSDFSPSPPYDFSEHSESSVPSLEALSPVSPASSVSSPACLPPSLSDHVTAAEYLVLHHPPCKASRKKAKPKPQQPKTKQMKFHEYKGPPSAQKPAQSSSSSEQQYAEQVPLNAQQHQLLIQLQMECEQQHGAAARQTMQRPPAADQPVQSILQKPSTIVPPPAAVQPPQLFEAPTSPQKLLLSNFEDLKVSDLKAELKKKGLPVSGSKPQLIQRLRSHSSGKEQPAEEQAVASSLEEQDIANDHIVQLQQIWIETLTREVERSREQLRECQLPPSTPPPTKTPGGENKKQIIQQLLQQKIQQQELQKRQQQSVSTPSLTALLESSPLNPPPPLDLELPSADKEDVVDFGALEEDFPGVLPIYVCTPDADLPPPPSIKSLPSFAVIHPSKPSPPRSNTTEPTQFAPRQPPNYSEATRHLKVKQQLLSGDGNPRQSKKLKPIKSQAVDDVLDILISSGELSPSAAQEPLTPKGSSLFPPSSEPFFPSAPKEVPPLSSSLQSVLDLTPPPSTGFSAAGVDFDFPLDLDLDGLESLPKKPDDHLLQVDNDRSMDDSGLIEWLEEYEESSGHFQPSYDSLLGHEALDFFSADLDFKPDPPFMPSWTEHAT